MRVIRASFVISDEPLKFAHFRRYGKEPWDKGEVPPDKIPTGWRLIALNLIDDEDVEHEYLHKSKTWRYERFIPFTVTKATILRTDAPERLYESASK